MDGLKRKWHWGFLVYTGTGRQKRTWPEGSKPEGRSCNCLHRSPMLRTYSTRTEKAGETFRGDSLSLQNILEASMYLTQGEEKNNKKNETSWKCTEANSVNVYYLFYRLTTTSIFRATHRSYSSCTSSLVPYLTYHPPSPQAGVPLDLSLPVSPPSH